MTLRENASPKLGEVARVRLCCSACRWAKVYDARRLIVRLIEKAEGSPATAVASVASHVRAPCPSCGGATWATEPEIDHVSVPGPTSPIAAAMAGGGPRPAEGVVEGVATAPRPDRDATRPSPTLITKRARALRKAMSEPEVMLWSRLRGRRADRATFRRQHPIGTIIVDFFCPAAQLAIEVDGSCHWDDEARSRDAARDRWLGGQGIAVMRVPAGEIYRDLSEVTDAILRNVEARRSASVARPPPPPRPLRGAVLLPPMLPHRGR